MVSVKHVIFDKDTIQDRKLILYSNDDIKKLDKAIVYIGIFELKVLKIKNIQLVENFEIDKTTPTITHQTDQKDEDLDINFKKLKK